MASWVLMCDRHDIGISIDSGTDAGQDVDVHRIFIYDNYPGGIGFSAPLFQMHDELLAATRHVIAECGCEQGCPGCVGPIGDTGPLAKAAALRILDLLASGAAAA
jgi:DEAD/DEAH box helicase domain-containing protein